MGILIWIIGAIAIAVIRNAASGKIPKFPRLPDGRHDTPLGPSGHRSWPLKPPAARQPGQTSLAEPHETIRETIESSNRTDPAPEYQNEKRRQPTAETERVFAGESGYDRMDSHPVGRPVRRRSPIAFNKDDLVKAVVMAEVLGPPRARQANVIPGKRRKP